MAFALYLLFAFLLQGIVEGSKREVGQPLISNGRDTQPSEVPWNAAIYVATNGSFTHRCGGTLVSKKFVITAAHCFWDQVRNKEQEGNYTVALGKYYRGLYVREPGAQLTGLRHVHLHHRFRGRGRNFMHDITVVEMMSPAKITNSVQLAKIDWDDLNTNTRLVDGNLGTASGWGITETGSQSEGLKSVSLPFVNSIRCYDMLPEKVQVFATADKFCAGYSNSNVSVCPGDSGGGFVATDAATGDPYLRGVVSIAFTPTDFQGACYAQAVGGFTSVSGKMTLDWLKRFVRRQKVYTPAPGVDLSIVSRQSWGARPPTDGDPLPHPTPYVVIGHTVTEGCADQVGCGNVLRNIQNLHMGYNWPDIAFSFLIGGDGHVYEARGWDGAGAHTLGYNYCSIGIAFIGTYSTTRPTANQLSALQALTEQGVRLGKLSGDYKLVGARQVTSTESPGQALYDAIKTLPHWSATPTACTSSG